VGEVGIVPVIHVQLSEVRALGVYFTPTLPIDPSGSGSGKKVGSDIRSKPHFEQTDLPVHPILPAGLYSRLDVSGLVPPKEEFAPSATNGLTLTATAEQFRRLLWLWWRWATPLLAGTSPDTSSRLVQASGEYRVNRQIGLLGSVGFERISDPTFFPDPEPDGSIGSVGVKYTPSAGPRSYLNVNHRYDSNFATGSASYLIGRNTDQGGLYGAGLRLIAVAVFNNLSFLTRTNSGNFIDSRTEQLFSLASNTFALRTTLFGSGALILVSTRCAAAIPSAPAPLAGPQSFPTESSTRHSAVRELEPALTPVANLNLTIRYANELFGEDRQQLIGLGRSLVYQLNDHLRESSRSTLPVSLPIFPPTSSPRRCCR